MVFPLFRIWLKPWMGSTSRSKQQYNNTPEGFRSMGGGGRPGGLGGSGGGDSRNYRGPGKGGKGASPLTNVTFTESEERIMNEMKVQQSGKSSVGEGNGREVVRDAGQKDGQGIFVMTELDISEDRSSQHHVDKKATRIHESW